MQDAFVRILLQRGAGRVAGGFHITVLILSFSPATVSGWLGDCGQSKVVCFKHLEPMGRTFSVGWFLFSC